MSAEAEKIAGEIARDAMDIVRRTIKSQRSWFGESFSTIKSECELLTMSHIGKIEAYAEQVARERAEPLKAANEALRATNDLLRAQLAAAQAKGAGQ